jgi:hypothetical protein
MASLSSQYPLHKQGVQTAYASTGGRYDEQVHVASLVVSPVDRTTCALFSGSPTSLSSCNLPGLVKYLIYPVSLYFQSIRRLVYLSGRARPLYLFESHRIFNLPVVLLAYLFGLVRSFCLSDLIAFAIEPRGLFICLRS